MSATADRTRWSRLRPQLYSCADQSGLLFGGINVQARPARGAEWREMECQACGSDTGFRNLCDPTGGDRQGQRDRAKAGDRVVSSRQGRANPGTQFPHAGSGVYTRLIGVGAPDDASNPPTRLTAEGANDACSEPVSECYLEMSSLSGVGD